MENKGRLIWFIFIRLVVVSLFLASTIFLSIKEPGLAVDLALSKLVRLIIATYLVSIASLLFIRHVKHLHRHFATLQIIWDLVFVTLLIIITGGINSPYPFLYILSIITASVLLSRRDAYYTASLCSILYGAIIDLQYYGKLTGVGLSQVPARSYGENYVFYTIFVNIIAYYLTAFLTGYLAERARKSESELQAKAIDYEELEWLSSTIVANLNSGLMTVNRERRIRVFNRYAEIITGISQEEAYDKVLDDILEGFSSQPSGLNVESRGEFEYRKRSGERLVIGFNIVPFSDLGGNDLGFIINFQDLTKVKALEAELKKSDRLATLGELSARIAHEIRNPLASISGSVQLIAQGNSIDAGDKKLLEIVLRETDRLNGLIRDFLDYARPIQPQRSAVDLGFLFDELHDLLGQDRRFDRIKVVFSCDQRHVLLADRDQIQQVLWNLLVNASEAIPGDGEVSISVQKKEAGGAIEIIVSDTGCGMQPSEVQRVFEPFFTTKPHGTGLGLATVYRVVEAHHGTISVSSVPGQGTVFRLCFPHGDIH